MSLYHNDSITISDRTVNRVCNMGTVSVGCGAPLGVNTCGNTVWNWVVNLLYPLLQQVGPQILYLALKILQIGTGDVQADPWADPTRLVQEGSGELAGHRRTSACHRQFIGKRVWTGFVLLKDAGCYWDSTVWSESPSHYHRWPKVIPYGSPHHDVK